MSEVHKNKTIQQSITDIYASARKHNSGVCRDVVAWCVVESYVDDVSPESLKEIVLTLRDLISIESLAHRSVDE